MDNRSAFRDRRWLLKPFIDTYNIPVKEILLFQGSNECITNVSLLNSLRSIGANDADVLYIHSGFNFGKPNVALPKNELLGNIFDTLLGLDISTLIFPSYTFSFCNGMKFNVQESKTKMGILNEFIRLQNGSVRSVDPLMSNVLYGKNHELVTNVGKNSIGENSTFDFLHKTSLKVKFLFLGPSIGDCFTYMHFIEERVNVPYRYNRIFTGNITNNGYSFDDSYQLFVRYHNVIPGSGACIYENILLERNQAKKIKLGDGCCSITDEVSSYSTYLELITRYPNFFLKDLYNEVLTTKEFEVCNMVSL